MSVTNDIKGSHSGKQKWLGVLNHPLGINIICTGEAMVTAA